MDNDQKDEAILQLEAELGALIEEFFALKKTVEGMQQLFIKAGEYQGKPRGRLPR